MREGQHARAKSRVDAWQVTEQDHDNSLYKHGNDEGHISKAMRCDRNESGPTNE